MQTKPVIIDGKPFDGPTLAKKLGIVPWHITRMRLNRGWRPYEAFHTPVHVAGSRVDDDETKAAWHDAERIRHESAAQHHRKLRDAALRRIDDAQAKSVSRAERDGVAFVQQEAD
jgi:hypothetical protein